MEKFKCLGVFFMSEDGGDQETDQWMPAALTILTAFYSTVMAKCELSHGTKLSFYQLPVNFCSPSSAIVMSFRQ